MQLTVVAVLPKLNSELRQSIKVPQHGLQHGVTTCHIFLFTRCSALSSLELLTSACFNILIVLMVGIMELRNSYAGISIPITSCCNDQRARFTHSTWWFLCGHQFVVLYLQLRLAELLVHFSNFSVSHCQFKHLGCCEQQQVDIVNSMINALFGMGKSSSQQLFLASVKLALEEQACLCLTHLYVLMIKDHIFLYSWTAVAVSSRI